MRTIVILVALILLLTPATVAAQQTPLEPDSPTQPLTTNCLYPSPGDRFAVTGSLYGFNMDLLPASAYQNWWSDPNPPRPNSIDYYPLIRTSMDGYRPTGDALANAVAGNPGAIWLIGNEADTIWMDNVTPEAYAQQYHDVRAEILALDPSAKFVANGLATVSPLRLAWLDRAWNAYRNLYGTDMPVDYWNIHTYVVNEMVYEWGPQIPTGFENVIAYAVDNWQEIALAGASGGTVHQSRRPGARAYFAFHGDHATLRLATGPDAGIATIYIDKVRRETVDLYAPVPGFLNRTYSNLVVGNPLLADWHHVRVDVSGTANAASSNTWIRVDALQAPSTASLPTGRLEDNFELRSRIILTIDEYGNLDRVEEQVRMMRQWMAAHGQRNKPLINSEFGILIGEEQGWGYPQVRDFMLGAFNRFMYNMTDPAIGMPDDDNRLLQEWFWFNIAIEYFDGYRVHTGLFDPNTYAIISLGRDYANFVNPIATDYADLETTFLTVEPRWPLFAGQASELHVWSRVQNRGNLAAGQFRVDLKDGPSLAHQWTIPGLSQAHGGNDIFEIDHTWQGVVTGNKTLAIVADSAGQVNEPCEANNTRQANVVAPPYTDLALDRLRMTPPYFSVIRPGQTANATFDVDLANLGSVGSSAGQIVVRFWDGQPGSGGTLLSTQTVQAGPGVGQTVSYFWQNIAAGDHRLVVEVEPAPGETRLDNNRVQMDLTVPAGEFFSFLPSVRGRANILATPEGSDAPATFGKGYAMYP